MSPCPFKALSLSRPWPWVIMTLGKRIENRCRKNGAMPSLCKHRGPLLLHAAKSWDADAEVWLRAVLPELVAFEDGTPKYRFEPVDHPAGVIFARCDVVDTVPPHPRKPMRRPEHEALAMRWHMPEQYGLVLENVEPTRLVPCKGALGLWDVPDSVLAELSMGDDKEVT